MSDLKIIYMGTPEFAVPGLKRLHADGHQIVAVITAPDKPKGRGKKVMMSAVKEAALDLGLPVLQPTNLKDPDFLQNLKDYQADLQIIVAFRMLPEAVWNMPPLGSYNLHASLLPNYRGAAPINWAIINGEAETGLTTFKLKHEIDTGNILMQETEPIHPEDNVGTLYERLMVKGAVLLSKSVEAIASGTVDLKEQVVCDGMPTAPKIFKEDCKIDWHQEASTIVNFVRGLSPYPAAWTDLNESTAKIFVTGMSANSYSSAPGTVHSDNKTFLDIQCGDGRAIAIKELQLQGKKRMKTDDFLRGYDMGG